MTDNDKEEARYKESSSTTANQVQDCNSSGFCFFVFLPDMYIIVEKGLLLAYFVVHFSLPERKSLL